MVTARNRIELGRITGCPPSARSIATSPTENGLPKWWSLGPRLRRLRWLAARRITLGWSRHGYGHCCCGSKAATTQGLVRAAPDDQTTAMYFRCGQLSPSS